jgi:hypothetical protein
MTALQDKLAYIFDSGWDRQTLILLGVLLILLAGWLCYRIFRQQPVQDETVEGDAPETTLITRVPPPPLPKIEKIIGQLQGEYSEFTEIVRYVLGHTPAQTLLANTEIRRSFAHLEALLTRSEKVLPKGTLGISTNGKLASPEIKRDAKATMLTLIRLMQEMDELREKNNAGLDKLVDRFLEKV